ncbi:MAG: hypothetical protein Q8J89_10030 [Caulobacter sp.]|nr:hypothetical protein [Caulobacter sp.]
MRRLALLALMSLALAAPAGAQDGGRIRAMPSEPSVALRGPVGETPDNGAQDEAGSLAALVPMPPPVAPVGTVTRSDTRQCRQSCNRAYYFCLSAEEDICAPAWTQCTARCGRG